MVEKVEALQQREIGGQAGGAKLVDVLGLQEIAPAMCAKVEDVDLARQRRAGDGHSGFGEQGLIAVSDGEHAGEAVQSRGQVVAVAGRGGPDVDRHAHAQRSEIAPVGSAQGMLAVDGRGDGVRDCRKRGLDGVADGLEEDAVVGGDRLAHEVEVALDRGPHRLLARFAAAGGAFW